MATDTRKNWLVFTAHGAFRQEGESAKIALGRFRRIAPESEVVGIIREDLVVKPPSGPGAVPFLCMFIQGELQAQPETKTEAQKKRGAT
jgi:hypothetical protein